MAEPIVYWRVLVRVADDGINDNRPYSPLTREDIMEAIDNVDLHIGGVTLFVQDAFKVIEE